MKTIAIVGGGFSGAMTAVNVARFCQSPLRVVLVNHKFPLARGVAYSTRREEHLLNVAARNMSALADYPNHFVEWLQSRTEFADVPEAVLREWFVPRRIYGDYVRSLFGWYRHRIDGGHETRIDVIEDEAVDIEPVGDSAAIHLAGGQPVVADKILLATGNQPPTPLTPFEHPRYVASPWEDWLARLPERQAPVIVLGTGLTMVDAVLTLLSLDWQGPIRAISRSGLLPLSHFKGIEYPDFPPADVDTMDLATLARVMKRHAWRLRKQGANPAIVVDRLRPHTQRIWQRLSLAEKRHFLRHWCTPWNVVRHRIAQSIHEQLHRALASGQLCVSRGQIRQLSAVGDRVQVSVVDATGTTQQWEGGLVINCTGPDARFSASRTPLFRNLVDRGLAQGDDLDLGIRVDSDFGVIDAEGRRNPLLFAMGPLVKGTLWETTAVPELRGQALRVAQLLLEACGADEASQWPVAEEEAVIEYCI